MLLVNVLERIGDERMPQAVWKQSGREMRTINRRASSFEFRISRDKTARTPLALHLAEEL